MANKNIANAGHFYMHNVMPVVVHAGVNIGTTGAVTSITGGMVTSVTRISAGKYKINLEQPFNTHIMSIGSMQSASGGLSGISQVEVQNAPTTSISSVTAPSITVTCLNTSGAATDPASGSRLDVLIMAANSSVKIGNE